MPRNGSGSYSPPTNSFNPAINGVPATAADWQTILNDISSALTQSLSRDGQTPLIGNLPAGGNKLTDLAAGTAAGDSLRFEQLFSQGQPADLASAATTDIGAQLTTLLNITGTTTITSFGANYNGPRFLRFAGVLTLTHNAATLILPGNANIVTAAGDSAIVVPNGAPASGWRVVAYQRAADVPGAVADGSVTFAKMQDIPTATIMGRTTAGTGDPEALTAAQAAALIGTQLPQIQPISASVAANALTISASALSLDFRSVTLDSGAVTRVSGTPANLVISSGSTLGTINAIASRIVVLAINNAGTIELAAVNISGGNQLDETNLISTTAEGGAGAADSASVIYSTTARTNVAYRVIGYIDSTQATAGTWATAPSTIQGQGGQALAAMSSLGYGQTWQNVTGSRVVGTTYYNTTGKPIQVSLSPTTGAAVTPTINGVAGAQVIYGWHVVIPAGASYSIALSGGAINGWNELR